VLGAAGLSGWQLLVLLAARKAADLATREGCRKRRGGLVRHRSALGEGEGPAFVALLSREPDPAFAAQVAGQSEHLLGRLAGPTLRQLAVWKLEGRSNAEIAGRLGCSLPTVERNLRRVRAAWEKEANRLSLLAILPGYLGRFASRLEPGRVVVGPTSRP
jgi:DNA-directed RNA polymerase specialized sigma24 family protein